MQMDARKKAELLEAGGVEIDDSIVPHLRKSTAGPGSGPRILFLPLGRPQGKAWRTKVI